MIAAFLTVTVCVAAPSSAPTGAELPNQCSVSEVQTWIDPTPLDLEDCASLAEQLRTLDKRGVCEVVPMENTALEFEKLGSTQRQGYQVQMAKLTF